MKYYKIDWNKVKTSDHPFNKLLEILELMNLRISPSAGLINKDGLKEYLILSDEVGHPLEPAFKVGDEFILDGNPIGIVDNKGSYYYINFDDDELYYYCVRIDDPSVGIAEVSQSQLAGLQRYTKEAYLTTQPPLPTTLAEAVEFLLPRFKGFDKIITQFNSEDAFAAYCHSQLSGGIGMQIRNELQLWQEETPLRNHFESVHHLSHPDDMSGLVLRETYRRLADNNIPPTTRSEAEFIADED